MNYILKYDKEWIPYKTYINSIQTTLVIFQFSSHGYLVEYLGRNTMLYLHIDMPRNWVTTTVYPNKYAHGFVVLCFVVVM